MAGAEVGFELDIYMDGVWENALAGGSGDGHEQRCRTVHLAAGHYFKVWMYQSTESTIQFKPGSIWNWMTVDKIDDGVG